MVIGWGKAFLSRVDASNPITATSLFSVQAAEAFMRQLTSVDLGRLSGALPVIFCHIDVPKPLRFS